MWRSLRIPEKLQNHHEQPKLENVILWDLSWFLENHKIARCEKWHFCLFHSWPLKLTKSTMCESDVFWGFLRALQNHCDQPWLEKKIFEGSPLVNWKTTKSPGAQSGTFVFFIVCLSKWPNRPYVQVSFSEDSWGGSKNTIIDHGSKTWSYEFSVGFLGNHKIAICAKWHFCVSHS